MDLPMELTLEQQFSLKLYEEQVKQLNPEDARQFTLELLRQLMIKDNMLRHLLRQEIVESRGAL